jgi:hypothetical protein
MLAASGTDPVKFLPAAFHEVSGHFCRRSGHQTGIRQIFHLVTPGAPDVEVGLGDGVEAGLYSGQFQLVDVAVLTEDFQIAVDRPQA